MQDARSFLIHLGTAPAEGGVAVFELYGSAARPALERLLCGASLPAPGRSRVAWLHARDGSALDEVVVSRRPAAAMWSRMPAWTVAIHGGLWLQDRVGREMEAAGGKRVALERVLEESIREEALDAVQAAAFCLLLDAPTERAAAFLLRQYEGELSSRLLAAVESLSAPSREVPDRVISELRSLVERSESARRLSEALAILVAGRPNSGKSTLFNRLTERERAIVSPTPGTTRDILREKVSIEGYPVELLDGAGLHALPADEVEREAIVRSRSEPADVALYLQAPPWSLADDERAFLGRFGARRHLVVANFKDTAGTGATPPGSDVFISALRGDGVDTLKSLIVDRFLGRRQEHGDPCATFTATQTRHIEAAVRALELARHDTAQATLDAARDRLIQCLRASWPHELRES